MAQTGFGERFPARNSAVLKALAANVRRPRKERGWTQDDLAAETRVEQAAISLIENGRANPTLLMLEAVAKALDVTFVELFAAPVRQRRPKDRQALQTTILGCHDPAFAWGMRLSICRGALHTITSDLKSETRETEGSVRVSITDGLNALVAAPAPIMVSRLKVRPSSIF